MSLLRFDYSWENAVQKITDKPLIVVEWSGGVDRQHPFSLMEGKKYQQMESVICYRK
jgi:hypothetical protein